MTQIEHIWKIYNDFNVTPEDVKVRILSSQA